MRGGIILFLIIIIIYVFVVLYIFSRHNNKRQRILTAVFPFIIVFAIGIYGLCDDYLYSQKLKKHPEYTHINFISPINEINNSIIELKSVLNVKKWPLWIEGRTIAFKDLLSGNYIRFDSIFTNDSIGLKNISFLEMNSINSFELISNSVFVTYRDSISKNEGFYYELLSPKDISLDRSSFRSNLFDTIDYKGGLYLLRKKPLN